MTYFPQIYDPRSIPRYSSIHAATKRFSVPWSPLTRLGVPYVAIASKKTSRTVAARLLLLARMPVTNRDLPSIKQWMTILKRIRPAYFVMSRTARRELNDTYRVVHRGARVNLRQQQSMFDVVWTFGRRRWVPHEHVGKRPISESWELYNRRRAILPGACYARMPETVAAWLR
jgi:hypothetical protein